MKKHKVRITKACKSMAYGGQQEGGYALDVQPTYGHTGSADQEFDPEAVHNTISQPKEKDLEEGERFVMEAEKGEHIIGDFDGSGVPAKKVVSGRRHHQGGEKLTNKQVPGGAFVYSDSKKMKIKEEETLKMFGKTKPMTPADIAKQYNINKYKAILQDPDADPIERKTAEFMIANMQQKLGDLALVQEAKKGFPQGIPQVAQPQGMPAMPEMAHGGYAPHYDGGGIGPETEEQYNARMYQEWLDNKAARGSVTGNDMEGMSSMQLLPQEPAQKISIEQADQNDIDDGTDYNAKQGYLKPGPKIPYYRPGPDQEMERPGGSFFGQGEIPAGDNNFSGGPKVNQYQKTKGKEAPFAFSMPDMMGIGAAALNLASLKRRYPWIAPTRSVLPQATYYDPTRELAANSEQANSQTMAAALTGDPRMQRAISSAIQGQSLENIANITGRYNNQNVGVANQMAGMQADITNKQMAADAERATKLYDGITVTDQQYSNATAQGRNQLLKSYMNAFNNRSKTDMLNQTNEYFYTDPRTGRMVQRANIDITKGAGAGGNKTMDEKMLDAMVEIRNQAKTKGLTLSEEQLLKLAQQRVGVGTVTTGSRNATMRARAQGYLGNQNLYNETGINPFAGSYDE